MAFKMKGSPHKMGGIKGTSGHTSALKQKLSIMDKIGSVGDALSNLHPDQGLSDVYENYKVSKKNKRKVKRDEETDKAPTEMKSPLEQGTSWWDKTKALGRAVWDAKDEVHGGIDEAQRLYKQYKKEYRDEDKESSNKMKSPLEQKRKGKKEVEDVMGKAIKGTVTKKGKKVKIYTKSKGDVGKRRNVTKTVVNEKTGKVKEKKITGARASRQVERAEKKGRKTKGPIIATDE